jgi:hypothetical protein
MAESLESSIEILQSHTSILQRPLRFALIHTPILQRRKAFMLSETPKYVRQ